VFIESETALEAPAMHTVLEEMVHVPLNLLNPFEEIYTRMQVIVGSILWTLPATAISEEEMRDEKVIQCTS